MLETESSKHCHVTSSRITHVGLRNHHSILSVTFPECLMLEDGIITTLYREFLPEWMAHFEYEIVATLSHEFLFGHGSLWTMKCSQSIYVNLSWILDYGIVTTSSRNFLMNSVCWTMILQHALSRSVSWIVQMLQMLSSWNTSENVIWKRWSGDFA